MQKTIFEQIYTLSNKIKNKIVTILFSPCFFKIGKRCSIIVPFRFDNLQSVQLGDRVTIHQGTWINALDGGLNSQPKIVIGNNVSIGMNGFISSAQKIIIEDWVLLGRNVYISDHSHEFEDVSKPISMQGIRKIKKTCIGAETWIGNNSVILPGALIGKHCVIGANSVVKCEIPDFSIAVGSPARIIGHYDVPSKKWVKNIRD
jgi:acetyltransferase-like isoleucine patch superfamily enzyme